MRSLLFIPADSPKKLEKGFGCGADAVIVDLEDSVAIDAKVQARDSAVRFLAAAKEASVRPRLFVRVNGLDSGLADGDVEAVVAAGADGIMLPKASCGADVALLDAKLAAAEALAGIKDGSTSIIPIATETGGSLFAMGSYAGCSKRLVALTWGAEDLSADVGALTNRSEDGGYTDLFRLARSLCLAASAHAEIMAIDTVFTDFRDSEGLQSEARQAERDGFVGKMAIHPAQVAVINEVFAPSPAAIQDAEAIIAAFAAVPDTGVTSLNGRMLDRPHLRRAQRVLARARAARS